MSVASTVPARLLALLTALLLVPLLVPSSAQAAVDRCRNGYVALTFDDGPSDVSAPLLDALRKQKLRATFFVVGAQAQARPELVARMAAEGHAVGNHSYSHPFLDELDRDAAYNELLGTQQILRDLTGAAPVLFRPPFGRTTAEIRGIAAELGTTEVLWTVDTRDWDGASVNAIVAAVAGAGDGDVVLMHELPTTVAALPRIARGLRTRGMCAGAVAPTAEPLQAWEGTTFDARAAAWPAGD